MKKIILTIAATLFSALTLVAQEDSSLVDFYKGGFLHFTAGTLINNSHDLNSTLNSNFSFGKPPLAFKNISTGVSAGLGTMLIFDKRVMLGAKSDFAMITSQGNSIGKVSLNSLATELTLGKIVYNNSSTFIYPYLGIGFHKYFMTIQNVSPNAEIDFDGLDHVMPGKSKAYSSNSALFELGLGIKHAFSEKFTMGIELGGYFSSTSHGTFRRSGTSLDYREAPGVNGAFVKLTVDLVRYSKKAYIDTTRRIAPVKEVKVADKPAVPAKEEPKPSEKKEKKKKSRSGETDRSLPADSTKAAPKVQETGKDKGSDNGKPSNDRKRPGTKAKPSNKKQNYNDQLFNFGSEPAKAPEPKPKPATTAPPAPKTVTPPADSSNKAAPDSSKTVKPK